MKVHIYWVRHQFLRLLKLDLAKSASILRNVRFIEPKYIKIGAHTVVNNYVLLDGRGGLFIGDNVDIARDVNIWTMEHNPADPDHAVRCGQVIINDYVWIASRATILPNITIGKGAIVASCSVVTKNVPEKAIVAGNPAKIVGYRDNDLNYELSYRPLFE